MLRGVRAPEVMYRSWLRSAVTWVGVVEVVVRLGFDTPLRGYSPRGGCGLAVQVVDALVPLADEHILGGGSHHSGGSDEDSGGSGRDGHKHCVTAHCVRETSAV